MKRRTADCEENVDSALEKALQFSSHLGMSRELRMEQIKVIYTLSEGDLLAVLPSPRTFCKPTTGQRICLIALYS